MKLYDSVGPNPRIVRMFMAEKGIEVPKQAVDLRKGENREAEHLKRNPHGQMPTLELDNGNYVSEITAICEYLEEKHPNPPLIGSTPEERAESRMWTRRIDLNICEHMGNGFRFGEGLKFFEKRIACAPEASPGLKLIAANRLQWLNDQMDDAGRHPAQRLARFRRHGRPAAGYGQHQHRGMDGARGRTAVGESITSLQSRKSLLAGDGFHHSANFDHAAGRIVRRSWKSRVAHAEIEHRGFSAVLNGYLAGIDRSGLSDPRGQCLDRCRGQRGGEL
jgi:glutathione S-transferase